MDRLHWRKCTNPWNLGQNNSKRQAYFRISPTLDQQSAMEHLLLLLLQKIDVVDFGDILFCEKMLCETEKP